jgi:hypothetical protein
MHKPEDQEKSGGLMTKEEKSPAECAHDVKGLRAIVSSGILAI